MAKKEERWYWSSRRKAYALETFDITFKTDKDKKAPGLRAHHYKDAIVFNTDGGVWLYESKQFDDLIRFIEAAKWACLNGPTVKDEKELRARQDRQRARARLKRARMKKGNR